MIPDIYRRKLFATDEAESTSESPPEPKTRREKFLAKIAGEEVDIEPKVRREKILAKIAGDEVNIEPKTRTEKFLSQINAGNGNSGIPEDGYDAVQFTIDKEPISQWTNGGFYHGKTLYPSAVESCYNCYGKRLYSILPCTAYLQPTGSPTALSGIVAVLMWTNSIATNEIQATASRGTVSLIQVTNRTIAIWWTGTMAGDPVTIMIGEKANDV